MMRKNVFPNNRCTIGCAFTKGQKIAITAAAIFVAAIIALVCIEPLFSNRFVVKNRSGHSIKSVTLWYEDDITRITEELSLADISAGTTKKTSTKVLNLDKMVGQGWLTVAISFEDGGEAVLQSGQILNHFTGKLLLEIHDTKSDELEVHLKAGEGYINSSSSTGCDDVYYIDPTNGYVE